CALTPTGQPAASADPVSPPATENANGKLDAANTATGPMGWVTRCSAGPPAAGRLLIVSRYPPSASTSQNIRSWAVVRATSPVSRAVPSAVSVSASAASSPARASSASATAASAAARRPGPAPAHGSNAPAACAAIVSTALPVVSATGSPAGLPVRGSYPWIMMRALSSRVGWPGSAQLVGVPFRAGELPAQVGEDRIGQVRFAMRGDDL